MDIPEVQEKAPEILEALRQAAGHTRVLSVSAATTHGVQELMTRLRKFVQSQPEPDLPPPPEIDLSRAGLDYDSDDFEIISDPSYPGQWRNPYIPPELLERDELFLNGPSKKKKKKDEEEDETPWRPFPQGGFLDVDEDELVGFGEEEGWELLEDDDFFDENGEFVLEEDDEVWTAES
eukprot:scaffold3014_cov172-Amphora_coffeaeformis.AAC.9